MEIGPAGEILRLAGSDADRYRAVGRVSVDTKPWTPSRFDRQIAKQASPLNTFGPRRN